MVGVHNPHLIEGHQDGNLPGCCYGCYRIAGSGVLIMLKDMSRQIVQIPLIPKSGEEEEERDEDTLILSGPWLRFLTWNMEERK